MPQSPDTPQAGTSIVRFVLTVGAWVVGLFALLRVPWVQENVMLKYAGGLQVLGCGLAGTPTNSVVVDFSCTGADAMALCLGAILAFPVAWHKRLLGGAIGLVMISAINVVRIGMLSRVIRQPELFKLLHVYVWPAILILAVAAYVFLWMRRVSPSGSAGAKTAEAEKEEPVARQAPRTQPATGLLPPGSARLAVRFLGLTALFVVLYYVATDWLYESATVLTVARWASAVAGGLMKLAGITVHVTGNYLRTDHGAWIVTQECIVTPLIPIYFAAALTARMGLAKRIAAVAAGPLVFMLLGTSRLLVLALPKTLIRSHDVAIHAFYQMLLAVFLVALAAFWFSRRGAAASPTASRVVRRALAAVAVGLVLVALLGSAYTGLVRSTAEGLQAVAGHAGHAFRGTQGAFAMLPAYQLGFWAALWIAAAGFAGWRRALAGLAVLAAAQVLLAVAFGEVARHVGLAPHVTTTRALAVAMPLVLLWWLARDAGSSPAVEAAPEALPQHG